MSEGNFSISSRSNLLHSSILLFRLNLLKLAPGGHVGRLIIWTESAFNELNDIFGTRRTTSKQKHGYQPPRAVVTNCDITRIINSPEVQSQLRQKKKVFLSFPLSLVFAKNIGCQSSKKG